MFLKAIIYSLCFIILPILYLIWKVQQTWIVKEMRSKYLYTIVDILLINILYSYFIGYNIYLRSILVGNIIWLIIAIASSYPIYLDLLSKEKDIRLDSDLDLDPLQLKINKLNLKLSTNNKLGGLLYTGSSHELSDNDKNQIEKQIKELQQKDIDKIKERAKQRKQLKKNKNRINKRTPEIAAIIVSGITMILLILTFVISLGSSKKMAKSIPTVNTESATAPTMHKGQTPVAITPNTISYKVKRAMSDVPNSNLYELCYSHNNHLRLQAQYYHNHPVYIVPIRFRGFWKYHHSHKIPGYFRINATSPSANPVFVHKPMHYNFSDYFNHKVERDIKIAYPGYKALSHQAQLEINNSGHPYNVETMYKPGIFNTNPNFKHLHYVVEDAETGKIKIYNSKHNTPKWMDENITSDVADKIFNTYGHYRQGFWNRFFTGSDLADPTDNGPEDGVTTVFSRNHTIHYVTDFTSTSSSKSALGYGMLNARTGKLVYYHTHGITDSDGAMHNANDDGQVRNQHYSAEMPVLYKVHSHPTWVMNITDNSGFQRGFYYVDSNNPDVYAYDSTNLSCLNDFEQSLVTNIGKASNSNKASTKHFTGTISRCLISTYNHRAILMLNGNHNMYTINTDTIPKAQMLKAGDNVSFSSKGNTITKFTDKNL